MKRERINKLNKTLVGDVTYDDSEKSSVFLFGFLIHWAMDYWNGKSKEK